MTKIKVLIADDVDETRALIKKIVELNEEQFIVVGEVNNGESVLKAIPSCNPDIILMDINMPILNGLEATEKICDQYPNIGVIIMSVQGENEYLKSAMLAGAKGYIVKPIDPDELKETIIHTYDKLLERQVILTGNDDYRDSKTMVFYSSKGGVGKSVISLNTAIRLSNQLDKKVLLIDLDLYYGDLALMSNKQSEKTIIDIIDDDVDLPYQQMKQYFHQYNEALDILYSPLKPEQAEYVSKEAVEKIYETVKDKYDYVIFDCGVNFSDITLYALDISESIFYITSMELASLKNTKIGLGVMKSLNYNQLKVNIIVNQVNEKYGIAKKEVEEVFTRSIYAYIEEDTKAIRTSVNTGLPVASNKRLLKSKLIKNIDTMIKKIGSSN